MKGYELLEITTIDEIEVNLSDETPEEGYLRLAVQSDQGQAILIQFSFDQAKEVRSAFEGVLDRFPGGKKLQ